jgi:hypothetical protein
MDYPGKVITKTQVTPTQTSASGNWTLDDQAAAIKNNNWPVALVPNPISKSLRFNSADSAYLNRTPASAGNRRTWTWSGWVKRSALVAGTIFGAGATNGNNFVMYFESDDTLVMLNWTSFVDNFRLKTTQVFRDVSAWYHIVAVLDTTQATSSNRVKLYLNGTQITVLTTATYPTQNFDSTVNTAAVHTLGARSFDAPSLGFNGYMTEVNFIDGQALTPSSFGMTNPQTGQWIPLKYSGTYGTNGFYLNFKDATSTTTLGYDYSGNANNWTTNNFSVTAGAGNDSLTDVPTPWVAYNTTGDVGGVIRGNYCTWNPLAVAVTSSISTFTNGNLDITTASSGQSATFATIAIPSSGKWYWEVTATGGTAGWYIGVAVFAVGANYFTGNTALFYANDGNKYINSTSSAYGATYTTNDIIGIAANVDSGTVTFYKNGTSQGSITYASGEMLPFVLDGSSSATSSYTANFGQRPFAYTPPTGFRSLCTTNLPATTIGFGLTNQGDDYFNANLYTGTGSAFTLTGVGFQPDFGWFKGRNASSSHWLHDVVRGANPGLSSNSTAAEDTTAGQLTAFASDGYSLPNDTAGYLNFSGRTMVVWSWKAGGTGVSNTAGTITSTVSANTTAGFSVVTYTGNGTIGATVGHGLGATPSMIIIKNRGTTDNWIVYNQNANASPATGGLFLEGTNAFTSSIQFWNNTAPTSTVFSLYNNSGNNANTNTYVAYCFAAVPGYSAFGSYTGNGSADGPFVYVGFRPRYVMVKASSTGGAGYDWFIHDTARDTYNVCTLDLEANLALSENQYGAEQDILSNGFKLRNTGGGTNGSGVTYIYMAFAEFPFQFANAR